MLNGFTGTAIGFATALQVTDYGFNACSSTMENTILGFGNLFYNMQYFYLAYYWSAITESFNDTIVLQATIYENCQMNKAIETASTTFTQEGINQMLMRVSSAMAYNLPGLDDYSLLTSGY